MTADTEQQARRWTRIDIDRWINNDGSYLRVGDVAQYLDALEAAAAALEGLVRLENEYGPHYSTTDADAALRALRELREG